jgi:uncharacterized membrane protein YgcG
MPRKLQYALGLMLCLVPALSISHALAGYIEVLDTHAEHAPVPTMVLQDNDDLAIDSSDYVGDAANYKHEERIDHFDILLKVEPSGDLLITERIQVTAAGNKIRHGIYREIPTTYSLPSGFVRKTPIDLLSVTRDGQIEPFKKEGTEWGVRYYIGSPDSDVEQGPHLYELQYRMDGQLHLTADKDELYWNLTGNQWAFPITQATATIELPEGALIDQMAGYTGYAGSTTGRAYKVLSRGDNVVKLVTTRPLSANEGFTIALDWPSGLIKHPSAVMQLLRLLWDNPRPAVGLLTVLTLFAYYVYWWRKVGAAPAKGMIFPRYEAPQEVSPARAGYVWNEGFSGRFSDVEAMTVTVTDLARRKVLSIADAPKSAAFIITAGKLDKNAQAHEKALFGHLFSGGKAEIRVGNKYVKAMSKALAAHSKELSEWGDKFFRKNRKPWCLGVLGAVIAFVVMGFLGDALVMLSAFFPFILGVGLMVFGWATLTKSGYGSRLMGIVLILFGLPFALVGLRVIVATSLIAGVCVALIVIQIVLFRRLLEAPTVEGRQILDALEGYREYLQLAESGTLAGAAHAPAMTIALYEQHLPYAMALGVEQQWTARLSAAIESGVIELAEPDYRPEWYRNSSRFSTPSELSGALTAAAVIASTPPPSPSSGASSSSSSSSSDSSSSGGGESGGGGGGGGGGGW